MTNKKLKILTILGTRPEIIRLSRVMPKLDRLCEHRVLHTGQNFDPNLSDIFFKELNLRAPDHVIDSKSDTFSEQLAKIMIGVEEYLKDFWPDKVLVLGDTNSGLASIICERMGFPVYHMEAGNRCYDLRVPEEKNRKLIDSISTINLPYTNLSRENLLREGISNNKIYVTGNPIYEVLEYYKYQVMESNILTTLDLRQNDYIIATAHRAENVDDVYRLHDIFNAFNEIAKEKKIVFSCHPRTKQRIESQQIQINPNIIITEPLGFFDFVRLESQCFMGISDSGTVQEELCLMYKPTVTIRATTERPETVWCGSNIVSGLNTDSILYCYNQMKNVERKWKRPEEYVRLNVSDTVVNILLSNLEI